MASRINSGGSIDLDRIKIDPRTGEKFSFNLDIVAGPRRGMARKRAENWATDGREIQF